MARYFEQHGLRPRSKPAHSPATFFEDTDQIESRTREYGERPHGWGNFETNYDLPSSTPRRVDQGATEHHRGKGPRSFRRSDERLKELACEALTDDPFIDATDIDVHVEDGVIMLTGFVDSRRTKFLAEELLAECLHEDIVNRLQLKQPREIPRYLQQD